MPLKVPLNGEVVVNGESTFSNHKSYKPICEGIGADSLIHGNENITDCAFVAFSKKSAAFYHFSNTSGTYCGIVDKISIGPKKDPNIQHYLIDADLSEIEKCPNGAQSDLEQPVEIFVLQKQ
uniref:Uncharacterized protein n=1 Tax=Steinernema glaseri TaxID=37863 RepID=A0A1I7ZXH4_9BILA